MKITDVILDFDGTCTQIPGVVDSYLEQYLSNLNKNLSQLKSAGQLEVDITFTPQEWKDGQAEVRAQSPNAGWMAGGCPAAPAAADPYILADETTKFLLRRRGQKQVMLSPTIHAEANHANPAQWRDDARETILKLIEAHIHIHFISNSSTLMIRNRLQELFGRNQELPTAISVQSDAAKFRICELTWDHPDTIPQSEREYFLNLPATYQGIGRKLVSRPVYLRRGSYFEAICRVLDNDLSRLKTSVFCGDIWEMDLAMPYAIGANVHLIERSSPFSTYDYEREAVDSYGLRARASVELAGLLEWI